MPQEPGAIIGGRYRLDSLLGRGGMGVVWRARHLELGSEVAVKLIEGALQHSDDGAARFRREAKLAAALRSPYVVQVFDYGVDGGVPYLVMELLEGESLAERLDRCRTMPLSEVASMLGSVARAVGKAHEMGFVHRDLKPQNIFLAQFDDEQIVKVLDFGIAKAVGLEASAVATRTNAMLGTLQYMSPEQTQGAGYVDWRTDLWAMGVIAYECVVGASPFEGTGIGDIVMKVMTQPNPVPSKRGPASVGFDAWFARACAKDPEQRFRSAQELVNALAAIAGGGAVRTPAIGAVESAAADSLAVQPAASLLEPSTRATMSHTVGGAGSTRRRTRVWAAVVALGLVLVAVFVGVTISLPTALDPAAVATQEPAVTPEIGATVPLAEPAVSAPASAAASSAREVVDVDSLPVAEHERTGREGGRQKPDAVAPPPALTATREPPKDEWGF